MKVVIPVNFINEDECAGIKEDGGVVAKAIREIEIMCLAGNIPESIDIDSAFGHNESIVRGRACP